MKYTKIFLIIAMSLVALQAKAYKWEFAISDEIGKEHQDEKGETVLHAMARDCRWNAEGIPAGINPWSENKDGRTAHDLAALQSNLQCQEVAAILDRFEQVYLNNLLVLKANDQKVQISWGQPMVIKNEQKTQNFVREPYLDRWFKIKKTT